MTNKRRTVAIIVSSIFVGIAGTSNAQQPTKDGVMKQVDLGKLEFESNCAICHGLQGRGDGPYADILKTPVANLSTLSQRNGGVFPFERVSKIIDGTQVIRGHGTREMPIWGDVYTRRAETNYYLTPKSMMIVPFDADAFVRARILALTEYVYRLQTKRDGQK